MVDDDDDDEPKRIAISELIRLDSLWLLLQVERIHLSQKPNENPLKIIEKRGNRVKPKQWNMEERWERRI